MCLTTISKEKPKESGTGWIVVLDNLEKAEINEAIYHGEARAKQKGFFSAVLGRGPFLPGVEEEAVCAYPSHANNEHDHSCRIRINDGRLYTAGFHIFLDKEDAENFIVKRKIMLFQGFGLGETDVYEVIKEVTYRGAHTKGTQGHADVVVAKYRTIKK